MQDIGKAKKDALNQAIENVLTAAATLSNDERQAVHEAQVAEAKSHLRAAKIAVEKLDTMRCLVLETDDSSRSRASWHIQEALETIDDL